MPPPHFANKRHKHQHQFIPAPSSGAHSILVGMLKAEQNEFVKTLNKQQVLDFSIKYSKKTITDKSKVWASMKGLVDKGFVDRRISRDPLYYLLEDGRNLALKLVALEEGTKLTIDESSVDSTTRQSDKVSQAEILSSSFEPFTLKFKTYDVILVIDQREKIEIQQLDQSIKFETRTLACGDFLWLARPKDISQNDRTKDLVLDYIVERKRLDD